MNHQSNNAGGAAAGPKIDLSKAKSIKCDECGAEIFMPAMKFKTISKLLTGSKEDQIIPVQVFVCMACGSIPKQFDIDE